MKLLLATLLFASPLGAEPPSERAGMARKAFEQGREAFSRARYAAAAAAFEEAASFVLHPAPLVNAADAWVRAGDPLRAARACDRALAIDDVDPRMRALAEEQLTKVLPQVATLEITGWREIDVRIDGSDAGPLPIRVRLLPGNHTIEASDHGRGASRRVTLALDRGRTTTQTFDVAPAAPPARTTGGGPPVLTYVSYGVAALGTGLGTYFTVAAVDARDRWEAGDRVEARSDFYRDRTLADVAFGIGLAGVIAGTIAWVFHKPTSPESQGR